MAITSTTFQGVTFNLLVEEFADRDAAGRLNAYLASTYKIEKGTSARLLIRRSRLPGAAAAMRDEIERDGIQAFRRFSTSENSHSRIEGNHNASPAYPDPSHRHVRLRGPVHIGDQSPCGGRSRQSRSLHHRATSHRGQAGQEHVAKCNLELIQELDIEIQELVYRFNSRTRGVVLMQRVL
ncbi:hypothetical protein IB277_31885 [Ensifer sp. ENS07]|uniref:hypothetical protein n=1 Tax=Ensifer sp. ENS07 TaxID=2769274 RepID=UPI00177B8ED4|nr:hypothetical protein [Ensifer sp. ENS07]MBD9640903.1 hypothetical protein [Ensifer sp. ENS07]